MATTYFGSSFLKQLRRPTVWMKVSTFGLLVAYTMYVNQEKVDDEYVDRDHFSACSGDAGIDWADKAFVGVRSLAIGAALVAFVDVLLELSIDHEVMKSYRAFGTPVQKLIHLVHSMADLGTITIISVLVHGITLCSEFSVGSNILPLLALVITVAEVLTKDKDDEENGPYSLMGALRRVGEGDVLSTGIVGRIALITLIAIFIGSLHGSAKNANGVPEADEMARNFVCADDLPSISGSDADTKTVAEAFGADYDQNGTLQVDASDYSFTPTAPRGLLDPLGVQTLSIVALVSEVLGLIYLLNKNVRNPIFLYLTTGITVSVIHTGLVCGGLTLDGDLPMLLGEIVVVGLLLAQTRGPAAKVHIDSKFRPRKYRAVDLVTIEEA